MLDTAAQPLALKQEPMSALQKAVFCQGAQAFILPCRAPRPGELVPRTRNEMVPVSNFILPFHSHLGWGCGPEV